MPKHSAPTVVLRTTSIESCSVNKDLAELHTDPLSFPTGVENVSSVRTLADV